MQTTDIPICPASASRAWNSSGANVRCECLCETRAEKNWDFRRRATAPHRKNRPACSKACRRELAFESFVLPTKLPEGERWNRIHRLLPFCASRLHLRLPAENHPAPIFCESSAEAEPPICRLGFSARNE